MYENGKYRISQFHCVCVCVCMLTKVICNFYEMSMKVIRLHIE